MECTLFKTYAYNDKNTSSHFIIPVHGRIFSTSKKSASNRIALSIARTITGLKKLDALHDNLEDRLGLFFHQNVNLQQVKIELIGIKRFNTKMTIDNTQLDSSVVFIDNPNPIYIHAPTIKGFFKGELKVEKRILNSQRDEIKQAFMETKTLVLKSSITTEKQCVAYGTAVLIEHEGVSVISDIDDTIKDSQVYLGHKILLNNTFVNECKEVDGMAEVYKYWSLKGVSFHYVSNSPWQLYPMLVKFFEKNSFPLGSAHLKLFSLRSSFSYNPMESKYRAICEIIKDFPKRKFILVGDSGEQDIELYSRVAREFDRTKIKIFIRDVTTTTKLRLSPTSVVYDEKYYDENKPKDTMTTLKRKVSITPSTKSNSSIETSRSNIDLSRLANGFYCASTSDEKDKSRTLHSSSNVYNETFVKLQLRKAKSVKNMSPDLLTIFDRAHLLLEDENVNNWIKSI